MNLSPSNDSLASALETMHSSVNARHPQTKLRLLESLPNATRVSVNEPTSTWAYVVSGPGLSAVASTIAVAFTIVVVIWLMGSTSPAEAMERLARALDQVGAYSYRMEKVHVSRKDQGRTVRQVTDGHWRTEPTGLRARIKISETLGTNTQDQTVSKTLVDLEESHQAGEGGTLVNHLKHEYWHIDDELNADSIPPGSPQVAVFMVQQRRGRVLRDLGKKEINGQHARGLEITLDDGQPVSELGLTSVEAGEEEDLEWDWRNVKFEVWINPDTDLPIEFRCVRRGKDYETTFRFTDLRWHVEFPPDAFDLAVPDGYKRVDKSSFSE